MKKFIVAVVAVVALLLGAVSFTEAAYSPVFYPKFKAFQVGTTIPLSGGKVYTYLPGTTTPATTYQDSAGSVANTNPIILDANGECVIYYDGYLKLILTDSNDVQVWTAETASSSTGGSTGNATATYDGIVYQETVAWGNPGTVYVDGPTDNLVLDWSNLPSDLKAIKSVSVLPACGTAVSANEMVFLTTDGKLYTCQIDNTWLTPVSSDYVFGAGNFPADLKPVLLLNSLGDRACDNVATSYGTVAFQLSDEELYKCESTGWTSIVTNDPTLRPILTADNVSTIACDNVTVLYGSLAYQLSDETVFKCDVAGWNPIVIADNVSIALENFPSDLRPIKIAAVAPTCPSADYPVGSMFFNTSTNKLNRCESSGWTYATLVADLQGEIASSQIADNAVVAGKIAANAVTASSLAADSVVAGKIAAGAVASSEVLADYVVVNSKLAANAVTASNLAANSVIAGKISAGAINASNILANGVVVNDKLAANAVTADKIAAGAISASHIASATITADKLAANHLSAANTESGTFQQGYKAPGNDNTTPGAGFRVTGGVLEAYGGSHSLGGTIISSDGNYMTTVGKYLTTTGKTKRYPLNNATNFTADGQVHVYEWDSGWEELAVIGGTHIPVDWSIFSAKLTGAAYKGFSVTGNASGIDTRGFYADVTGIGSYGADLKADNYGAKVEGATAPLLLVPSSSASAPTHSARLGSLWVTSAGVLYINTSGSTTWAKVGAQ